MTIKRMRVGDQLYGDKTYDTRGVDRYVTSPHHRTSTTTKTIRPAADGSADELSTSPRLVAGPNDSVVIGEIFVRRVSLRWSRLAARRKSPGAVASQPLGRSVREEGDIYGAKDL